MEYNGELYFNATNTTNHNQRLFKTSGSGATVVADINGIGGGYNPKPLNVINNKLLFSASSIAYGRELFITDGTATGTEVLLDIYPDPNASNTSYDNINAYAELNGELYFWAQDRSGPMSLWKTDGTTTGTVKILQPTSFRSGGTSMKTYNGKIYFIARSGSNNDTKLLVA